jgi:hypothetical protein
MAAGNGGNRKVSKWQRFEDQRSVGMHVKDCAVDRSQFREWLKIRRSRSAIALEVKA